MCNSVVAKRYCENVVIPVFLGCGSGCLPGREKILIIGTGTSLAVVVIIVFDFPILIGNSQSGKVVVHNICIGHLVDVVDFAGSKNGVILEIQIPVLNGCDVVAAVLVFVDPDSEDRSNRSLAMVADRIDVNRLVQWSGSKPGSAGIHRAGIIGNG